jgi:putative endopeptidase
MTEPLSSGFAQGELHASIRPQDDLHRYVNGTWMENTEIPADKSRYGTFDILADGSEAAIHEILEESLNAVEGTEARKVGDLYASFLDEARVNELAATPLVEHLARVEQVTSIPELLELIGSLQRRGGPGSSSRAVCRCPTRVTTAKSTSQLFARLSWATSRGCSN